MPYIKRCDICKSKIYEDIPVCPKCGNCCCTCDPTTDQDDFQSFEDEREHGPKIKE
jgi:hypothetical protein